MVTRISTPSFAPYEAAKQNGTVALLPAEVIRIYNRLGYQREVLLPELSRMQLAMDDLAAFRERFVDSPGALEFAQVATAPDLAQLNDAELSEYLTVVATLIKRTDVLMSRFRVFYWAITAGLDGTDSEQELLDKVFAKVASGDIVPGIVTTH